MHFALDRKTIPLDGAHLQRRISINPTHCGRPLAWTREADREPCGTCHVPFLTEQLTTQTPGIVHILYVCTYAAVTASPKNTHKRAITIPAPE